jgi:hypothetical protein
MFLKFLNVILIGSFILSASVFADSFGQVSLQNQIQKSAEALDKSGMQFFGTNGERISMRQVLAEIVKTGQIRGHLLGLQNEGSLGISAKATPTNDNGISTHLQFTSADFKTVYAETIVKIDLNRTLDENKNALTNGVQFMLAQLEQSGQVSNNPCSREAENKSRHRQILHGTLTIVLALIGATSLGICHYYTPRNKTVARLAWVISFGSLIGSLAESFQTQSAQNEYINACRDYRWHQMIDGH